MFYICKRDAFLQAYNDTCTGLLEDDHTEAIAQWTPFTDQEVNRQIVI